MLGGQRIMIVDDDPGIRRALHILLSREGYSVTQACDGQEAIRMWREKGVDLVITDLHMPEKNGIEKKAFIDAFNSFTVQTKMKRATQLSDKADEIGRVSNELRGLIERDREPPIE